MRWLLRSGVAALLIGSAWGQTVSVPAAFTGCAVLSLTNASTLASTATACPTAAATTPAWPSAPQMVYVMNSAASAGVAYLCPGGGNCSTGGIVIAAGDAYGVFRGSSNMTLIAASTATVTFQW